ncbi:MAG: helix-hairpin-helix domain-containing protein [Bacteroidales bacterium]|nr:helix-hairpin-helix domain-containing protein [Bacteroidales bacterium]
MKLKSAIQILFLLAYPWSIPAQDTEKPAYNSKEQEVIHDQDWNTLLEEMAEKTEENINVEEWQELLAELAENPVALNTATKETLESIPFLNESLVEALSYYIYRYGPMVSLSELLLVEGMDEQMLRWLTPFVCLGKPTAFPIERPSLKKALKYGKQEIRVRFGRSLQEKAGYANASDSTLKDKSYLGDPNQIYFRYGFNYKEKMQWGLIFEKDAGEKCWNKKKGIDYTSYHFAIRDQKRIKTLIVGDYNLKFGQGLVCANSFSLGKSVTGTIIELTGSNLSRHFSSSESGFFRGIGTTFVIKPFIWKNAKTKGTFGLEMTTFASLRSLDAKITNGSFSTISSGELHRTTAESEIKDQVKLRTMGVHLSLKTDKAQFGLTGLAYGFNANWNPEWKPYNCFYFRGRQGGNMSIDYRLRYKGLLFFGEMAMDEKKKTALISGISFQPYSGFDFSLLGRNYHSAYHAAFGNAFSEGTYVRNEYGLFAVGEWRLIKKCRLNAYYDLFVFPWLKYGINAPSNGSDCTIQATWVPSSRSQLTLRFKTKVKDKNTSGEESTFLPLERQLKNQLRFQISTKHGFWTMKSVLDGNCIKTGSRQPRSLGFAASQEVNYTPEATRMAFSIRYVLFDTNHFDNRIYSYERDLPGSFAMAPLDGEGSRFSLLMKYSFTKGKSLQIKIRHSAYRDREKVGTALEEVQGNTLTDIRWMFLWKF